jgi:chromosome segregation ATPase
MEYNSEAEAKQPASNKVLDHYLNSLATKVNELNLNKIFLESQLALKNEEIQSLNIQLQEIPEQDDKEDVMEEDFINLKQELADANNKIKQLEKELESSEFNQEGDSEQVEKLRQKNLKLEAQIHELQVSRRKDRKK